MPFLFLGELLFHPFLFGWRCFSLLLFGGGAAYHRPKGEMEESNTTYKMYGGSTTTNTEEGRKHHHLSEDGSTTHKGRGGKTAPPKKTNWWKQHHPQGVTIAKVIYNENSKAACPKPRPMTTQEHFLGFLDFHHGQSPGRHENQDTGDRNRRSNTAIPTQKRGTTNDPRTKRSGTEQSHRKTTKRTTGPYCLEWCCFLFSSVGRVLLSPFLLWRRCCFPLSLGCGAVFPLPSLESRCLPLAQKKRKERKQKEKQNNIARKTIIETNPKRFHTNGQRKTKRTSKTNDKRKT